jgi:hypothetical protein
VRSWKTTLGGILAAIGVALPVIGENLLGINLTEIGATIAALGLAFQGLKSRDDDVSSEGTIAVKNVKRVAK